MLEQIKNYIDKSFSPLTWERVKMKLITHLESGEQQLSSIEHNNLTTKINNALISIHGIGLPRELLSGNSKPVEPLRGEFQLDKNAYIVSGEPAIFHCHHYNVFLQAIIKDTSEYLPGINETLKDVAQEISYTLFSKHFQGESISIWDKKYIVEEYFSFAGFGKIELSSVNKNNGLIETDFDHYGLGWKTKFGLSREPVSFFTAGFLAGGIEAIYELELGELECNQINCIAMGHDKSSFEITPSQFDRRLSPSQSEGVSQNVEFKQPSGTSVDFMAVRDALTNLSIEGNKENGLINMFDVLLARQFSNYYCNISYSVLKLFEAKMGKRGMEPATNLLKEAGHICAFNTFGGIMQSNEWNGLIKPMIKTKEDWLHGIVAVANTFGWGCWEVLELDPGKKLKMKISNGYEANSYIGRYGSSAIPISFLATGGTAGLMNLIYTLDFPNKAPITLDEVLYRQIHLNKNFFTATQLKCRAMGDEYDIIEATSNA